MKCVKENINKIQKRKKYQIMTNENILGSYTQHDLYPILIQIRSFLVPVYVYEKNVSAS